MKTHLLPIAAGLLTQVLPLAALAQDDADAAEAPAAEAAAGSAAPAGNAAPAAGEPAVSEAIDTVRSNNVRLHTVQRKQFSDGGTSEIVLFPAVLQINQKFTTHFGSALQYAYHLHENFALQAMGSYFFISEQTGFTDELITIGRQAPQAATALTLQWAATGGFEVTPIYGKFALFDTKMAHFGLVLTGGIGIGGSRIQILSDSNETGATFGDTGLKFVGEVGAGFRVRLSESFLVRLELKDLVYTAKVDTINGCNAQDLTALTGSASAPVSSGCKPQNFKGGSSDYAVAAELVSSPSSDVLNNLGVYTGVSYSF